MAAQRAYRRLHAQLEGAPDFMVLVATVGYDFAQIAQALQQIAPNTSVQGTTSARGVMTDNGFHAEDGRGLGLLGIRDAEGTYGVGHALLSDGPREAGERAVLSALSNAGRSGELPQLIWLTSAPGSEEEVIAGIQAAVGPHVPILGGSAADEAIDGQWKQADGGQTFKSAAVVSVLFPSNEVMYAFHSGYEPTDLTGVVTAVEGRTLLEIDGKPAAEVYNEWSGGLLSPIDGYKRAVVSETTMHPLGRRVASGDGPRTYLLAHPKSVTADGGLHLFAQIEAGEEVTLMSGTTESLIERAGRVVRSAMALHVTDPEQVSGGLVVFCAGCMMAVEDRIDEVVDSVRVAMRGRPFLGMFTFGEQGCFFGGENRHGNLMISALLLRRDPKSGLLDE